MKIGFVKPLALSIVLACWFLGSHAFAASASPALMKAKQEAEAKGFVFATSRDEIVAKAKKEGRLRVISSLDPDNYKHLADSFKKKYPFIDAQIQEISGTEANQRLLLELKAGTAREWDVSHASEDFYDQFAGQTMKFDILGMAEQGVLKIIPQMIDSGHRTFVSMASTTSTVAYNKNRIPPDKVPNKFEDFLKADFKGRKFIVDIRPNGMAALMVAMGEEWVVNYARKIKEQQPIWTRGNTRALASIITGEYIMHQLTNYQSCVRASTKDTTKALVCKIIEPVPVRLVEHQFVLRTSSNPYSALLWLEYLAGPEGQKIIDEYEPVKSNLYAEGEVARLLKGKKVSLNDYKTFHETPRRMKMVLEAYGFPKAELK
ncbi:MAG: extracellular solute-binding protein [Deltaproteobacteria bacterium]|nr:extracellular solute-binding protein [Deltaproteobacteria bacterium]